MKTIKCKLTVYFAEPFWVGVFERICDGKLSVAKVTFGAEPKDYDIQEFVLKHYYDLQFSPAVETIVKKDKKNPKRVLRDVKKQLQNNGIGTKSQQALKLQHELKKEEYKIPFLEKPIKVFTRSNGHKIVLAHKSGKLSNISSWVKSMAFSFRE